MVWKLHLVTAVDPTDETPVIVEVDDADTSAIASVMKSLFAPGSGVRARLALLVILAVTFAAFAQEQLSEAERKDVDAFMTSLERGCMGKLALRERETLEKRRTTFLEAALFSNYCPCLSQQMRGRVSPSLLRGGSEAEGVALVKEVGTSCVMDTVRSAWQKRCPFIVSGLAVREQTADLNQDRLDATCGCVQKILDAKLSAGLEWLWQKNMNPQDAAGPAPIGTENFLYAGLGSCMQTNSIAIREPAAERTSELARLFDRAEPTPPDVAPATAQARAFQAFGLEGRWSRDCADFGPDMGWTIYYAPAEGATTIESFRGGSPEPTLLYRYTVLSTQLLDDDRFKIVARRTFPYGTEEGMTIVMQRIGRKHRIMQAAVTRGSSSQVNIRNGVFLHTQGETPLMERCER